MKTEEVVFIVVVTIEATSRDNALEVLQNVGQVEGVTRVTIISQPKGQPINTGETR